MAKYSGADGWLYEEGKDKPRRYQQSDNLEGPNSAAAEAKAKKAKSASEAVACLGIGSFMICTPLLGMGIGYAVAGLGGLLAGLGVAVAIMAAVAIKVMTL